MYHGAKPKQSRSHKAGLSSSGFSAVLVLVAVFVVAAIGLSGWYVWHNHQTKKTPVTTKPVTSQKTTSTETVKTASPVFNKLPENWTEYKNDSYGLRFGFPKDWGVLDPTTLRTANFKDDSKNLQGQSAVSFSTKEGFTVVARKYGATIKPSGDGKSWVVVAENPANADGYSIGDTYKTTERKVNGGTAIDLTFMDEECTQTSWLIELKSSYAVITIPELCPVNFEPISAANKTAYAGLVSDFISTLTVY